MPTPPNSYGRGNLESTLLSRLPRAPSGGIICSAFAPVGEYRHFCWLATWPVFGLPGYPPSERGKIGKTTIFFHFSIQCREEAKLSRQN